MSKCYVVSATDNECSVLVWAETRGSAKSIAQGSEALCCEEWVDLYALREPKLDSEREIGALVDGSHAGDDRFMWALGWHPLDGSESCEACGLYVWDTVPESEINEDGVCQAWQRDAADVLRSDGIRIQQKDARIEELEALLRDLSLGKMHNGDTFLYASSCEEDEWIEKRDKALQRAEGE